MSSHNADADKQGPIRVTIFDQPFSLRSPRGAEHVCHVARLVDERMRQVAAHMTTYDIAKVAILTALNLADELHSVSARDEDGEGREATHLQTAAAGRVETEKAEARPTNESERSWFDAIFDAPVTTKPINERLSAQVSAKLQAQRQTDDDAHND
jgi:cell division protein ZapA